jgi:hypothetical protein
MALFGAPIAHEDHARRACYAALTLQRDLHRYANELRLQKGMNFSVRMGLNSGEVVVGTIGGDLRMDYTALGHTVSLTARMEQIAEPGKAYLTEHTAKLVEGLFQLRDLRLLEVKGAHDPLHVYELERIGQLRTNLEVSRTSGFSRFVGQEREIAALEDGLERAIAGNAQVVGVVAEPGVGKSRLCYEFLERCRARGVTTFEAHGIPHGKSIPLSIERLFNEALALCRESGAKTWEPFVHLERAEVASRLGDEATRERELREAHRLFLEIGAPIRAAEVAKELGL